MASWKDDVMVMAAMAALREVSILRVVHLLLLFLVIAASCFVEPNPSPQMRIWLCALFTLSFLCTLWTTRSGKKDQGE